MQGFFQHSRQERGISSRLLVRFNLPKDRAQLGSIPEKVSKIFIEDGFIKAIWQISHLSSATLESQAAQLYGHRAERTTIQRASCVKSVDHYPACSLLFSDLSARKNITKAVGGRWIGTITVKLSGT